MVDQPTDALIKTPTEIDDRARDQHFEMPGSFRMDLFLTLSLFSPSSVPQRNLSAGHRTRAPERSWRRWVICSCRLCRNSLLVE